MFGAVIPPLISPLVRWTGLATLIRHTVARNRVSILVYHDPAPEVLERHLRFLVKRYNLISLGDLVDRLGSETWRDLPPHALVLTFDDGHRGNAELLDLFRRYDVRPTIYVCSQLVGNKRHYWFREARDAEPLKGLPNEERLASRDCGLFPDEGIRRSAGAQHRGNGSPGRGCQFRFTYEIHPVLTTCSDAESASEIESAKGEIESVTG